MIQSGDNDLDDSTGMESKGEISVSDKVGEKPEKERQKDNNRH